MKRATVVASLATALALVLGASFVMGHETVYTPDVQAVQERLVDAEARITNLERRLDSAAATARSQSAAIDDLYAFTDELKARIDTGAVTWDQNAEVDDLYRIVDELGSLSGGDGG